MAKPLPDLFLIGTDRRVGKSVVALLMMQACFDLGMMPFYFKPIQTGCTDPADSCSDARFIYDFTRELAGNDPGESMTYCLSAAKAPFFAARDSGQEIDPERIAHRIKAKRSRHTPIIVEGTDGVLAPVSETLMMVDLIALLDCQPLVVARACRGTINHTLMTVATLKDHGVPPLGVVFVNDGRVGLPDDQIAENWAAVEMFGGVDVAAVIGPIADFNAPDPAYHQSLADILV